MGLEPFEDWFWKHGEKKNFFGNLAGVKAKTSAACKRAG